MSQQFLSKYFKPKEEIKKSYSSNSSNNTGNESIGRNKHSRSRNVSTGKGSRNTNAGKADTADAAAAKRHKPSPTVNTQVITFSSTEAAHAGGSVVAPSSVGVSSLEKPVQQHVRFSENFACISCRS